MIFWRFSERARKKWDCRKSSWTAWTTIVRVHFSRLPGFSDETILSYTSNVIYSQRLPREVLAMIVLWTPRFIMF